MTSPFSCGVNALHLALDVGKTGALAWQFSNKTFGVMSLKKLLAKADSALEIAGTIANFVGSPQGVFQGLADDAATLFIESQQAMPAFFKNRSGQPVGSSKSNFSLGLQYGAWVATLSREVALKPVEPRRWKKDLGLQKQPKEASIEFILSKICLAQLVCVNPLTGELCPLKLDHNMADALCILYWGLRYA